MWIITSSITGYNFPLTIRLINVGITGQRGFIGNHLFNFLRTKSNLIKLVLFKRDYFESDKAMQGFVSSCDVIVHTAAINRHNDHNKIYDTNMSLINKLINACEVSNSNSNALSQISNSNWVSPSNVIGTYVSISNA